jgi:diguanylate cyclase (GGDEF)-like protein
MLTSLIAGLGILAVFAISSTGLVASSHQSLAAQTATMNNLTETRHLLIQAISHQQEGVLDYSLTHSWRALDDYNVAATVAAAYGSHLLDLAGDDPQLTSVVSKVLALSAAWRQEWAKPLVESLQAGGSPPATGPLAHEEGDRRFLAVEAAFEELDQAMDQRRAATVASQKADTDRLVTVIAAASLVFGAALLVLGIWLLRTVSGPLARLSQTAASLVAGKSVSFRAERDDEIGTLARVLEQLRLDVDGRYAAAVEEAERSATYNKLADLISFSASDDQLVEAAVRAIRRLTSVPSGDIEIANPSQNRLVFAAAWGDSEAETGQPVPIDRMDRCPGIRRASAYVIPDVEDELAVRCPAHPTTQGAAACVPMMALGQVVGVIHLAFPDGRAPAETVAAVARVAEQIGIALANTRLMRTLESLAMTDSLTGLHNPRFFDSFLEQQLAAAARDSKPLGVIMIDIDHFKQFNDTHGHPAGDEALRAFGRVVRAVLRASDVVARYGGEEFIVALPGAGQEDSRGVAEKLRRAVEEMVIEIGPGRYARTTISLGVVATDEQRLDRKGLIAMADAALYRAKEGGRNRVATAPTSERELETASRRRRGGSTASHPISIAEPAEARPA